MAGYDASVTLGMILGTVSAILILAGVFPVISLTTGIGFFLALIILPLVLSLRKSHRVFSFAFGLLGLVTLVLFA